MNLIRSILSVFLVALVAIAVSGWVWSGGHPSPHQDGARFVLTLAALSSIGCLWLLWSAVSTRSNAR